MATTLQTATPSDLYYEDGGGSFSTVPVDGGRQFNGAWWEPTVVAAVDANEDNVLTPADDGETLDEGEYKISSGAGSFGVALDYAAGRTWTFNDLGAASTNPVSIGSAGDLFFLANEGSLTPLPGGAMVFDIDFANIEITASTAANEYVIEFVTQADTPAAAGLAMQAEQSSDFTAETGNEYPVDLSGLPAGGVVNVAQPTGTPSADDSFAVFDSRLAADNGIDGAALNRSIRINFTDNLHSLAGPDYAVINSAGARIVFTYVDSAIGWRIAANVNS
ncbi:MAG: hypothetical protein AAFX06_29690 [Planctomycetota bacterium]